VREGRTRAGDESVIPFFEQPDPEGISLDGKRFGALLDDYYRLRGWNVESGIPNGKTLRDLGLNTVADSLAGLA